MKDDSSFDKIAKFVTSGSPAVGKSSLILRVADDKFDSNLGSTIGVEFKIITIETKNGTRIKCQIWDTAGQERFAKVNAYYYRGCQAILFVFDVSKRESLSRITEHFLNDARWEHPDNDTSLTRSCGYSQYTCGILVGNKCDVPDKQREVLTEHAKRVAQEYDLLYMETSAKTGHNVKAVFQEVCEMLEMGNEMVQNELGKSIYTPTGSFETVVLDQTITTPRNTTENTSTTKKSKCCS